MWIKICANTNLDDALLVAQLGADAVGFVFAPSKRQVTAEQVAAITPHLPSALEKIGVFTSQDAAEITETANACGLTGVQLHGGFNLDLARKLREKLGNSVSTTQTIHWTLDDRNNAEEVSEKLREIAREQTIDRVLVDSKSSKGAGGTGESFDWMAAKMALNGWKGEIIIAGGLHPDNVALAITTLRPWGVDVASGVETSPGKKDRAKLSRFIKAARSSK